MKNHHAYVTEHCPHCDHEITMEWDVKERGYKAFCPVCGKTLMLCSECFEAEDNVEEKCDWRKCGNYEICFRILEREDA